ncbi:hypothetical protein Hypma_001489 [Hypsizygus marmoreus]|uniref:Uncharacterized protein n=1 Tax=Hypsizygus marmoreus TaxID=39966 RepID=A0A369K5Q0_HYPMA|nr:hypothetical protein Hypma_001489 [Hypsizygus marmoreus]
MSQRALEHAALSPARFTSFLIKGSPPGEPLPPFSTRILEARFLHISDENNQDSRKFRDFFLVPGGRFFITESPETIDIWDLGFSPEEVIRPYPLASLEIMTDKSLLMCNVTPDGSELRMIVATMEEDTVLVEVSIYHVDPSSSNPAFLLVANLENLNVGLNCYSSSENLFAFCDESGIIVWNFVDDSISSWDCGNEISGCSLLHDHIILFNLHGFSVYKLPLFLPRIDKTIPLSPPDVCGCPTLRLSYASHQPPVSVLLPFGSWAADVNVSPQFSVILVHDTTARNATIEEYSSISYNDPLNRGFPNLVPALMNLARSSVPIDWQGGSRICNGHTVYMWASDADYVENIAVFLSPICTRPLASRCDTPISHAATLWASTSVNTIQAFDLCPTSGRLCVMTSMKEIRIVDYLAPF